MSRVKITTYVDERTAGILKARAGQNETSVSEACAQTLAAAVKDEAAEGVGAELLLPAVRGAVSREVRKAVRREVGEMSDRLSHLLARSALESAASRRALYQVLVEAFGQEGAREINRQAWLQSVESIRTHSDGVREVLREFHVASGEAGEDYYDGDEDGLGVGPAAGSGGADPEGDSSSQDGKR